jgi:hypothetical protein
VLDTNGAGDTFAAAYMLAAAEGHPSPVTVAHWAAGQAVSRPQACKPACIADALLQAWASRPPLPGGGWAAARRVLLVPPMRHIAQLLGMLNRGSGPTQ